MTVYCLCVLCASLLRYHSLVHLISFPCCRAQAVFFAGLSDLLCLYFGSGPCFPQSDLQAITPAMAQTSIIALATSSGWLVV